MAEGKEVPADESAVPAVSPDQDAGVTWTASEFIAHEKSAAWYLSLAAVTVLISAFVFLVTKDKVSTGVVLIAGLLLGIYGSHKPRLIEYGLDQSGISIGGKHRGYHEFRSFSVAQEGAIAGITFMPLKRFAVPVTVYYPPADEEKIMSILSTRLPFEEHRVDAIDALMRRIRF